MATYEVDQLNITKDGNTYRFRGSGSGNGILYGTSNTAADVQAKTVTIEGISEYTEGLSVRIKFVNGQTYNGAPTLNINSLGAKNVQTVSGTLGMQYMWRAGEVVDFIYDGTAFIEVNGGISTTDYYGVTKLSSAVNSDSQYVAATPYAVKQAYDKATTEFTGADASNDGEAGIVPAPEAGDQNKVLTGGGTWEESPGARVYVVTCTVTNASGAYEHTFEDETVTASMKGVEIEVPNPYVFGAPILVTPGDGEYTVSCSDVCGTDTIKISFIKVVDDPYAIHSSEFDLLNNRLTAIENVYYDEHLTIHPSDWTLSGGVYTYTWLSNKVTAKTCVEAWAEDGSEESGLEAFDYEKVSGGVQITADTLATGDLPVVIRVMAVKAQDVVAIQGTDVATSVISGAANVDEALGVLDGEIEALNSCFRMGSAEERVGLLDGVPLYRKYISGTLAATTGAWLTVFDETQQGHLVKLYDMYFNIAQGSSADIYFAKNSVYNSSTYSIGWAIHENKLKCAKGGFGAKDYYGFVYYIKSAQAQ